MAKNKDLKVVYFDIAVKEIHTFVLTAIQMNLEFHVKSPKTYQKYTQASIFAENLRDIYYFGYNFASQVTKEKVIYRYVPEIRWIWQSN